MDPALAFRSDRSPSEVDVSFSFDNQASSLIPRNARISFDEATHLPVRFDNGKTHGIWERTSVEVQSADTRIPSWPAFAPVPHVAADGALYPDMDTAVQPAEDSAREVITRLADASDEAANQLVNGCVGGFGMARSTQRTDTLIGPGTVHVEYLVQILHGPTLSSWFLDKKRDLLLGTEDWTIRNAGDQAASTDCMVVEAAPAPTVGLGPTVDALRALTVDGKETGYSATRSHGPLVGNDTQSGITYYNVNWDPTFVEPLKSQGRVIYVSYAITVHAVQGWLAKAYLHPHDLADMDAEGVAMAPPLE